MRRDVLTGDWISVAAARQNRAFLPPAELDPLAPQTPTNPSEIPSRYDVAVFENRSPSFGPALADAARRCAASHRPPARSRRSRRPRPRSQPHLGRALRGRVLQPRARGFVRHADPDPRPHCDRGVGRPHGCAVGAARRRAGLPLREPRRGDRRDPRPPARADLRLSLRHPAHAAPARGDRPRGRRPVRAHPRVRAGLRARRSSAASTGPRSCRSPRAGRSRCTSCRIVTSPTSPRPRMPSVTSSPRSTSGSCAASTRCTTRPPLHRGVAPGARPRRSRHRPAAAAS